MKKILSVASLPLSAVYNRYYRNWAAILYYAFRGLAASGSLGELIGKSIEKDKNGKKTPIHLAVCNGGGPVFACCHVPVFFPGSCPDQAGARLLRLNLGLTPGLDLRAW